MGWQIPADEYLQTEAWHPSYLERDIVQFLVDDVSWPDTEKKRFRIWELLFHTTHANCPGISGDEQGLPILTIAEIDLGDDESQYYYWCGRRWVSFPNEYGRILFESKMQHWPLATERNMQMAQKLSECYCYVQGNR